MPEHRAENYANNSLYANLLRITLNLQKAAQKMLVKSSHYIV